MNREVTLHRTQPLGLALFFAAAGIAGVLSAPLLGAKPKAQLSTAASGTFAKAGDVFSVADAFAYEGKGFFGDETVVKVRLTGIALDRKAIEAALDLGGEIERQTAEDTGVVTLDIGLDASWEGTYYRLPGGASCGFCSSSSQAAQSHLRIENGMVKGKIKTKAADEPDGDGLDVDLTLAVPIAKPSGVTALPKDGGEPAAALLACRAAIAGATRDEVAKACTEAIGARLESFEDLVPAERAESRRNDLLFDFPSLALPTIEIAGGRTKGDQAELELTGGKADEKYRGSLFLRQVEGSWRIERDKVERVWE